MPKQLKTFNLRLPKYLAEDFFRLFPERGVRSKVLRRIVSSLVTKGRTDPKAIDEIIENLIGGRD